MKRHLLHAALAMFVLAACGGDDPEGSGGGGSGGGGDGGSGGGSSVPCGDAPLDCPAGETCWFASTGFACTPSGEGLEGDPCAPLVGQPTCGDGLLCVQAGGDGGACTPLCDPTAADACGEQLCVLVQTEAGAETHVCY